jgi:hypothetical protein
VGKKRLDEVREAPSKGYVAHLAEDMIVVGHTYCIRTADGQHYAKIRITKYEPTEKKLTFTWAYQEKESRKFD